MTDAEASLRASIAILPHVESAYQTLGELLFRQHRDLEAEAVLARAVQIAPRAAGLQVSWGGALLRLGRPSEALACSEAALSFNPDDAEANSLRGIALLNLRRPYEAIDALRRAMDQTPCSEDVLSNLGLALQLIGNLEEALAIFERAIKCGHNASNLLTNKAITELKLGDFACGWQDYERREPQVARRLSRESGRPYWLGETPLSGKTILVASEQGLGDIIQFCRHLAVLEQHGARVVFAVPPILWPLLRTLTPQVELVARVKNAPAHDCWSRLLSLPLALADLPERSAVPYLRAEPRRAERWRKQLGPAGFKIAISWKGSSEGANRGRSFPLRSMEGLARLADVRLISLQRGDGEEELQSLPPGMTVETFRSIDADGAFLDSAAIVEACDLTICCDTSLGHLAGALDRPTWLALSVSSDWRWLTERSDTPLYPSHRLFRQTSFDDWTDVFAEMERVLKLSSSRFSGVI